MAGIVEHRCATCGNLAGTAPRRRASVGIPFCVCARCGAYVTREPYDEWALMRPGKKLELLGGGLAFSGALGLLPALGYACYSMLRGASFRADVLALLAGSGFALAVAVWGVRLARLVRRSRRRMSDPMYQAQLVEFSMASQSKA